MTKTFDEWPFYYGGRIKVKIKRLFDTDTQKTVAFIVDLHKNKKTVIQTRQFDATEYAAAYKYAQKLFDGVKY